MNPLATHIAPIPRLASGVSGLDAILGGGFLQSGAYMVMGSPGSGKTILANQICYHHVAQGNRAVYVTLLAESHARMLQHLGTMSFYDESVIPEKLAYISAYHDLESAGLKGLMDVLRREMRARKTTVLVLDGLVAASQAAANESDMKKFIHEIQSSAVFLGCTVFLLTSGSAPRVYAEHTMVDGLIELEDSLFDARSERSIQVRKFRGSNTMRGKHAVTITNDGITVYPRIEAMYWQPQGDEDISGALSTGIPSLDELISCGGVPKRSVSVVIGSSGTGKTTMGLHFVSRSTPQEPGLLYSFFESPSRLRIKAKAFGIDLAALEASGAVQIVWHSLGEHMLDALGHDLLDMISAKGIKRVVIDGLSGFAESSVYPERTNRFFSCLANEMRRRGATALMSLETRDVVSTTISTPYGVSGFVDNLFFLRFVEKKGAVLRLLTITKMRDTDFDVGLNGVHVDSTGMRIAGRHSADGDVIPSATAVDEKRSPEGAVP
ncbi:serine/threonine protein kinase [soil metagenome]